MSVTVKVDGLRELERSLSQLKFGTGRNVMRRSLKKAAKPLADLISTLAPDDQSTASDDLEQSILVTSRLSRQARSRTRAEFKNDTAVEMFIGPSSGAYYGVFQEFGTSSIAPQPFMRPAWEQDKDALVGRVAEHLSDEISKTLARLAKV